MPIGKVLNILPYRLRFVSPVIPEKSPVFSSEIPAERRLRVVIVARCASVTSLTELTLGIAVTIASRTSGVAITHSEYC